MHLYLMQNNYGLIKVGQSREPEDRLIALRRQFKCDIVLLKVLEHSGQLEEMFLGRLCRFKRIGEWFNGTDRARTVIAELFDLESGFNWPFEFDRLEANAWLDQIAVGYDIRYWKGVRRRTIQQMKKAHDDPTLDLEDYATLDGIIETALDSDTNQSGFWIERKKKGGPIAVANGRPIPHYTTNVQAALTLRDIDGEDKTPNITSGDHRLILALCIDILSKRWGIGTGGERITADMPRGPYRQTAEDRARTGSRHRFVFRR